MKIIMGYRQDCYKKNYCITITLVLRGGFRGVHQIVSFDICVQHNELQSQHVIEQNIYTHMINVENGSCSFDAIARS